MRFTEDYLLSTCACGPSTPVIVPPRASRSLERVVPPKTSLKEKHHPIIEFEPRLCHVLLVEIKSRYTEMTVLEWSSFLVLLPSNWNCFLYKRLKFFNVSIRSVLNAIVFY